MSENGKRQLRTSGIEQSISSRIASREMRMILKRAFTLIELLVVILIVSVIGSVVIACFAGGMRAYDRVHDFGESEGAAYLALELIERDLKNFVPMSGVAFEGESFAMQFPAYRALPATDEDASDVVLLRYWFSPQDGLLRSTAPLSDKTFSMDGDAITPKNLAVSFEYGSMADDGNYIWNDRWQSATNFPQQVRVRFDFGKESDRAIEQTIIIPIGLNKSDSGS